MQVCHENWVVYFPEEPLEHVRHVLDEVIPDAQLHVAGILTELLHQEFNPGLGAVLPVDALMPQACGGVNMKPLLTRGIIFRIRPIRLQHSISG